GNDELPFRCSGNRGRSGHGRSGNASEEGCRSRGTREYRSALDEIRTAEPLLVVGIVVGSALRRIVVQGGHCTLLSLLERSPGARGDSGPLTSVRWTAVTPSAVKNEAAAGSSRTPIGEPIGASQPRPASASSTVSPIRTETSVSLPSGSTT